MANVTETAAFEAGIYQIETTDPVLGGENGIANVQAKQLANRTAYLKQFADEVTEARGTKETLGERLDIIESITGDLEETSAVSVQQAVSLDWLYRGNKIAFELWRPGYTLIDMTDIALVQGVSGDDSIDVASTAGLKTNEYYVVSDTVGSILIKITEILSAQRIRIETNLTRNLTAGVLTRCSMVRDELHQAVGVVGNIWLSKLVNVEDDATGGAVVIRRTLNSGEARLYFRDATRTSWTEVSWSQRRQGDGIDAGFADYEYVVPFQGEANLRVDIDLEDITIQHIVALSEPTGLGGYINPAMAPTTPVVSAPANGATNVSETPNLAISAYASPGDTAQKSIQFQVSTVNTFASVLHDTGYLPAALSYNMPAGILAANTTFYARARVQDAAGLWSAWSAASSFSTATSYVYIQTPALVSPANNAVDVVEQPTMQTGAFAVSGGTDTHASSQWQIRTAAGTWDAPLHDSGEDATNKVSYVVPAGVLAAGQSIYYMRARHKGTTYGWSGYSPEIKITTKQVYANVIGVCCTATGGDGGTWVHVDQSGATIANPGATYFNTHPVFGGIQDVTIDSQIMSKVPKFYFKRALISGGTNDGKEAWWISDQPVSGFEIHPAFKNAGSDIDQFYVGKYQASSDGSKLKSVGGVLPVVSISLTTSQAQAAARNTGGVTGFMLWSMFQWSAIQWLYLVENATMDSQEKTGMGRVSTSSAANVDATDVAQATYRGIVGLWGNVRQWVDGLKTDADGSINLWDRSGNKTWVDTGRKRAAADGTIYPTTFMDGSGTGFNYDDVFIGDTGPTSNANATAPDYQWFGTGEYFPDVGGHWLNDLNAGLWCVSCFYSATYTSASIGARLAKV